jgi:hypothetical protein
MLKLILFFIGWFIVIKLLVKYWNKLKGGQL